MSNLSDSSVKKVAVVGAGISGLAAAHKLKSNGVSVTLFEAEPRAGGKIKTVAQDGFIWDEGANTMTESDEAVSSLFDDLGIREQLQLPLSQNKRYIARDGLPVLIPSNPIALLNSNILSTESKLKIMLEPFLWRKRDAAKVSDERCEESVGEFFERHFGKEFVDYLIDPFVAGTSGGDPQSLSIHHAFPEVWNIENKFGSLVAGLFQSKKISKREKDGGGRQSSTNKPRLRGSFSFQGGMQTLVDSICKQFDKDELKLQCKAPISNVKEMKVMRHGNPFSLNFIPEVTCLPVSVIITTFKKTSVKRPLEGFGVLVPSNEQHNGLQTLGTLFSSMMFPDRAPSDMYLFTTFVGGSRNQTLAKASTDELKHIVSSDLQQLLGTEGQPTFVNHFYWSKAFPLYGRTYGSILKAIEKMESDLPGLFYAGNHKDGLSVGKAITSGFEAAEHVISYLNSSFDSKMIEGTL